MSIEALGNRHCLNGDFQFRTPMRNTMHKNSRDKQSRVFSG